MRFHVSIPPPPSLILLFFFFIIISCNSSLSSLQSQLVPLHAAKPFSGSLPPPKPAAAATALIAGLDGTVYLVDSTSGRVIWSFSTGSDIYHSANQQPLNDNINNASRSGLIECGDDWELIIHDTHFGKTRLPESVAEYVAFTPIMSDDGAVILGSKKSTVFEVDARTGRLLWSYGAADFDNVSATAMWSANWQGVRNDLRTKNNELADPAQLNSPEFLLKIVRTEYFLKSIDGSGMVLWTMAVAEFKALLLCRHKENPTVKASFDTNDECASDSDSGLDFAMPYTCQDRKMKEVYRMRKNFLFEPTDIERLSSAYQENGMLPMPTSNLMLPSQPNVDRFLPFHGGNMMLPAPVPNSLPYLQPKIRSGDNNDNVAMLPQPHMEITPPREVDVNKWLRAIVFPLGIMILVVVTIKQVTSKDRVSGSDFKSLPSKKKRARKSGKNNIIVDKQGKHLPSVEEEILTNKETQSEAWLHFDNLDRRKVGKLFLSNKEIAKGSNGTIVLEGTYEGREVAVKRLVKAHHDVARKEIQNLIASDFHPNIVRWYGVEYDPDFVYLALERCTCNLDDLIHYYSDISENPVFSKDHASEFLKKAQMEIVTDDMQCMWKENSYPSPLLLKLMRDIVSGLVHLHELGIIHRDLKPQNVLITKERMLCAKLSDMGISKRLLEDMSSLGHSTTGCGSSGWQAPEQLIQGRQTRAVDLFSLGCVLFFCMTAGRHPFGERLERDVNIVKNKKDLFLVEFMPEAEDLISCLLNPDPDLRPKAIEVLHHPLFWSSEMRLSFLREASDRVELEDRDATSDLLNALESTAPVALGAKWDEKMEPAFITNIGRYRRYKFDSVRDLLRVLRNKLNHYRELPQEIQELLGPVPEGFNDYFASRFPRLLIEVYKVICQYCKDDECFQRYFRGD
ncbi:serine/threonine-protein kinase/endoribonuclease IRE1a [Lotus japonicus]|uniref:serine/threonine-protein kinase/endoribonuclease IRE1a n=1 Tax=Lotus japonicus TaxID=34305 RepID=UPI002586ADDF|nr:serine/threonine-protein kinase/endoribonuclease IRE1a [Lotus japonicus]